MTTLIAKLDSKGRLVVPKSMRDRDELADGDVFVVDPNSRAGTITFVRVQSPILNQIAESEADFARGSYQSLEAVAAELGIELDGK